MSYYEPSPYGNGSNFYGSSGATASEETLLLASTLGLGIESYASLDPHRHDSLLDSPSSYPSYDPESPFNSSIVPVRHVGMDGILKTKLMGVGTDGGFLTSPLVIGKSKMLGSHSRPSTAGGFRTESPAVSTPGTSYDSSEVGMARGMSNGGMGLGYSNGAGGMGIGISGLNPLHGALEMGDYGSSSNHRGYGEGSRSAGRARTTSGESAFYPHAPDLSAMTTPKARRTRDSIVPLQGPHFVEHRFPASPPLQTGGPSIPATERKASRPHPHRTIMKAKSCSALNKPRIPITEPLTPTSNHCSNLYGIPGVPYNSPVDDPLQVIEPSVMPFSFADLYNFGLAADSTEGIDTRKSPYAFANQLLMAEKNGTRAGTGGYTEDQDFNLLHSLPTPYLAHGSGFSSPSSTYHSDTSPELNYLSSGEVPYTSVLSGPPMLAVSSIETSNPYVLHSPLPQPQAHTPNPTSRQPCLPYNARRHQVFSDPVDPSLLLSPTHHQVHAATSPGIQHFSYPTRFAAPPPTVAPPHLISPTYAPAQLQSYPEYIPVMDPSLFTPLSPTPIRRELTTFERNLETFDDIYEAYSQASTNHSTPGKRGRTTDDDEDGSGDYIPGAPSPSLETPRKRLRTVASAPNLPTTPSKRLRPGPRPKVTQSPQESHQSVFSVVSPPVPNYKYLSSPYQSDGDAFYGTDDEGREPEEPVTKEVIRSLYTGVASHHNEDGVKVLKRYICLMEGCGRTFPRKSAIESHIQTHLEDKPFICPHDDW